MASLPVGSIKVYVTVVSPMRKKSLGEAVNTTLTDPELSVADGAVHVTEAPLRELSAVTSRFGGQSTITGSTVSPSTENTTENVEVSASCFKTHMLPPLHEENTIFKVFLISMCYLTIP